MDLSSLTTSTVDLSKLGLGAISLYSLLMALLTLLLCLLAIQFLTRLCRRVLERTKLEERVRKLILRILRVALWIVTVLIVAQQLGIPMTSLVALLSVATLSVTLAVQDILSNVAGGLVILVTKPMQVGDYVETAAGSGTVREIGLSHTQLDTMDGLRVVVPNSGLSAGKITNFTTRGSRRMEHAITASYDAPVQIVREACLAAAARTPAVLDAPRPIAVVASYGESSISYKLYSWCKAEDYWTVFYALMENIKEEFDARGVEMTYNHLNIHILEDKQGETKQ
jgi:small conductance mechanosensitive channel